eukprot:PhM_4_TR2287/c0_g1_i1/m.15132
MSDRTPRTTTSSMATPTRLQYSPASTAASSSKFQRSHTANTRLGAGNGRAAKPAPCPLDSLLSEEDLMLLDAVVVGRGGGVRMHEVQNVPANCIRDREACMSIPNLSYRLRHPVVIQLERHAITVCKYPSQSIILSVPTTAVHHTFTFESPHGHGIQLEGEAGIAISFLIDDAKRRILLHKMVCVHTKQELPVSVECRRLSRSPASSRAAAVSPTFDGAGSERLRKSPARKPFRSRSASIIGVEPDSQGGDLPPSNGYATVCDGGATSSDTNERPASRRGSISDMCRETVIQQEMEYRRQVYVSSHRPSESLPATHDVKASDDKARRRRELEEKLEKERQKRQQLLLSLSVPVESSPVSSPTARSTTSTH